MHDDMNPGQQVIGLEPGETDREGAMAKADLHKLANYSLKLYKTIEDEDQLESWVQAKITKAADYIASVYHYLAYEMKFSHYGEQINDAEIYNESQKAEMQAKLAEAKAKLAALKELQAEKIINEGKVKTPVEKFDFEGIAEAKKIPTTWTDKSGKKHPATKVLGDKDSNKQEKEQDDKDDDKMDEVFDSGVKPGDTKKTTHGVATKTKTGLKHERKFKDDSKEKEDKKVDEELKGNQSKIDANKNGKIDADDFKKLRAGKKVKEAQADKDYDGDGKIESDKDEVWGSRAKAAAKAGKPFGKDKKVDETMEEKCDECGMYESKCECNKMEEAMTDVVKAEQPYKDPKTGKMITPHLELLLTIPGNVYPFHCPFDFRTLITFSVPAFDTHKLFSSSNTIPCTFTCPGFPTCCDNVLLLSRYSVTACPLLTSSNPGPEAPTKT